MKNTTIADVAAKAGVSKATVSAVINDKDTVKDTTRQAVLLAIEDLNYRPSASARQQFRSSAGRSIGLIIKEADNPYYAQIAAGVREYAADRGYTILVSSSEGTYDSEQRIVTVMTSKDVDGMILTPVLDESTDLSHIFELKRQHVPFVLLESIRGVQADLVDVNNTAASAAAAKYLIDQGHSRIVHFGGPRYSAHTEERIEGIRRAFSESHLIFSSEMIVYAGAHLRDGYEHGLKYFKKRKKDQLPTAVTCYNDLVAIGLLRALDELGLRVPEDISVIGYDDLELSSYLTRPLTTVQIPKKEMGRRAAEILIRRIESADNSPVEKVYLEAQLVHRQTTGPIAG